MEAVYLPQAAAHPIADHSMTQLFADGDAHPIGVRPIPPGIQHKAGIGMSSGVIEPFKNMIQLLKTIRFCRLWVADFCAIF